MAVTDRPPPVARLMPSPRPDYNLPAMPAPPPALRLLPVAAWLCAGCGATTGGNEEAWADSIREVRAFFDQHLTPAAGAR